MIGHLFRHDHTYRILEQLYWSVIARLNPAERTAEALADVEWRYNKTIILSVGKAALSMASGAISYLTSNQLQLAGGVVVGPEHAVTAIQEALGLLDDDVDEIGGVSAEPGDNAAAKDAGTPEPPDGPESLDAAESPDLQGDLQDDLQDDQGWPHTLAGDHPVPGQRSLFAAARACELIRSAPLDAQVLALISGGAGALMAMPAPGISLYEKNTVVSAMIASGVDRRTISMVSKHLSAIKGGQLAAMSPVPVTTLVVSDMVGDEVTAVGGGPTLPDPTTIRQACDVVASVMGWGAIPWRVRSYFEAGLAGEHPDTPKVLRDEDRFGLLAGTNLLVEAAIEAARDLGMSARLFARDLVGDVTTVAKRIAVQVQRIAAAGSVAPLCLVGCGQPTVALPPVPGMGGRAQHVALLVAREIAGLHGVSVLVATSDGVDGNSEAAGAVVDGRTWDMLIASGIDPERALDHCDSGSALGAIGATLVTGPTETHLADLVLITAGI